jgi:hypothetical protein
MLLVMLRIKSLTSVQVVWLSHSQATPIQRGNHNTETSQFFASGKYKDMLRFGFTVSTSSKVKNERTSNSISPVCLYGVCWGKLRGTNLSVSSRRTKICPNHGHPLILASGKNATSA